MIDVQISFKPYIFAKLFNFLTIIDSPHFIQKEVAFFLLLADFLPQSNAILLIFAPIHKRKYLRDNLEDFDYLQFADLDQFLQNFLIVNAKDEFKVLEKRTYLDQSLPFIFMQILCNKIDELINNRHLLVLIVVLDVDHDHLTRIPLLKRHIYLFLPTTHISVHLKFLYREMAACELY